MPSFFGRKEEYEELVKTRRGILKNRAVLVYTDKGVVNGTLDDQQTYFERKEVSGNDQSQSCFYASCIRLRGKCRILQKTA